MFVLSAVASELELLSAEFLFVFEFVTRSFLKSDFLYAKAIELGLREKQVNNFFIEFWKLKNLNELYDIYPQIEHCLPSFLKLHKALVPVGHSTTTPPNVPEPELPRAVAKICISWVVRDTAPGAILAVVTARSAKLLVVTQPLQLCKPLEEALVVAELNAFVVSRVVIVATIIAAAAITTISFVSVLS